MENMNRETEKLLFDAAIAANSVGIESFVIDEHGIRGVNEPKTVVMLNTTFDIEVPFDGIGVGDVAQLVQRYNLHKNNEPEKIEIDLNNTTNMVTNMIFKSKNLKIEYRCMNPDKIKAIKKANYTDLCSCELTPDVIDMMKRGSLTMNATDVLLVKEEDSDSLYMKMVDSNKSEFKFDIDGAITYEDDSCFFANRYDIKLLLAATKNADSNHVIISDAGTFSVKKSGINIIIPPRV